MDKFFPGSWQKVVGSVAVVVIGMITYAAVNKWFRIEQQLPSQSQMKKAA